MNCILAVKSYVGWYSRHCYSSTIANISLFSITKLLKKCKKNTIIFAGFRLFCGVLFFSLWKITKLLSQAVTLVVNIFAIVSLMGKQFFDFKEKLLVIDCYLPILPAMQVINSQTLKIQSESCYCFLFSISPIFLGWDWVKFLSILSEKTMTILISYHFSTITSM